jgi:uncharacterized protein
VHPESYPVVQRMAQSLGASVQDLIARPELLEKVRIETFQTEQVGIYTLSDIREELRKPGRDPREKFTAPQWREDVTQLSDLTSGMILEDVGVHQDGLVHVSELSTRFVKDPKEVVKVGQIVRAKVLSVDAKAKRIALSIKALEAAEEPKHKPAKEPEHKPAKEPEPPKAAVEDQLAQLASRFRTR